MMQLSGRTAKLMSKQELQIFTLPCD